MSLSVNIQHSFDGFQIDARFEAPEGLAALFGKSGSGKSTIIKSVAGLLKPNKGHIETRGITVFDSEHGIDLPAYKRRIGYIFQEDRLFPHLTVAQNLSFGRWFAPKDENKPDEDEIIEMLGLSTLLRRKPARLSGGEKQRAAIGRALLSNPQLILADEPLTALDDARKEEILPYFERLRDHSKVPILYVSHSASEVSRLATTVVALENGRVIKQGPAVEVLSDPNVTPLGSGAAGTFLRARVLKQHEDGISELDARGTRLLIPAIPHPVGTELRVRIEAQDVMISLEKPERVSALNVISSTVSEVRHGYGPGALVKLQSGENVFLARITRRSTQALQLQKGSQVFAIVKAVSIPRAAIGDRASTSGVGSS